MTEPKFTPGPWRIEDETTLVWGACNPDDTSSYGMGYPITECRTTNISSWAKGPDAEEGIANARLIAAAPDMYEALEAVLPFVPISFATTSRPGNANEKNEKLAAALSQARAALAKARGET